MFRQALTLASILLAGWAGQAQAITYDGSGSTSTWYSNHEGLHMPGITNCAGQTCTAADSTWASASLQASMNPGVITVDILATGWGDGWGQATYRGYFVDEFTVQSSTLAPGTPVSVRYSVLFDIDTTGGAGYWPEFTVSLGPYPDCCHAVFNRWNSQGTPAPALTQGVLQLHVGQTQSLTGQLVVTTGQAHRVPGTATANGSVHYFVDVLDPQARIQSASGFNYSIAAVPEPETWALLLAGLALVARVARRRSA